MQAAVKDKLEHNCSGKLPCRAIMLATRLGTMPLPIQRYDDPLFPFGRAVIRATQNHIAAFVFDTVSYLRVGAAGAIALERTLALIDNSKLRILHGPFSDPRFLSIIDEIAFPADALTVSFDAAGQLAQMSSTHKWFVVQHGSAVPDMTPIDHGIYWIDGAVLSVRNSGGEVMILHMIGRATDIGGVGEDFEDKLRAAVQG